MLDVVDLSRLQFALTALYHFIFVPLTLGLSFILVIMETIYVATGKEVYKDMTKFLGKVILVLTLPLGCFHRYYYGIQFGTNWSYYSSLRGDILVRHLLLKRYLLLLRIHFWGYFSSVGIVYQKENTY